MDKGLVATAKRCSQGGVNKLRYPIQGVEMKDYADGIAIIRQG